MLQAGRVDRAEQTVAFLLALRAQGVADTAVLRAMERVRRERFAPGRFADLARTDVSVPLPCGQTMTTPMTVATLLSALDLKPGARVLEIGTGSGYVTALLVEMGMTVVSLERYRTLALAAHQRLEQHGSARPELTRPDLRHADGLAPGRGLGAFDRILVNGVAASLPEALLARLAPGGRLVGALRVDGLARRVIVTSDAAGELDNSLGGPVRLPPLVPGLAKSL
jgi:protein-L-isoaspartate(D-aspartate) O-methyltransferase